MGKPCRSSEKPHRRASPPSRQEAVHGSVANLRPQVARAAVSAAEVAVFTREAADKVGATKMDRPEDVQVHPDSHNRLAGYPSSSKYEVFS